MRAKSQPTGCFQKARRCGIDHLFETLMVAVTRSSVTLRRLLPVQAMPRAGNEVNARYSPEKYCALSIMNSARRSSPPQSARVGTLMGVPGRDTVLTRLLHSSPHMNLV